MILLWQKHANPQGWLTQVVREAFSSAAAGGRGGLQPLGLHHGRSTMNGTSQQNDAMC